MKEIDEPIVGHWFATGKEGAKNLEISRRAGSERLPEHLNGGMVPRNSAQLTTSAFHDSIRSVDRVLVTHRSWLYPTLIALVTCLVYANSFGGVYLFDDFDNIADNAAIRSLTNFWFLDSEQVARGLHRRPIINASLALNYAISGLEPWSYHLVNLLIHLGAGFALYALFHEALRRCNPEQLAYRWRFELAFSTALLWSIHPLQTESVTYVIQRCESLMGLFYLVSILFIAKSVNARRPWLFAAVAIISCGLGMWTKEVMVTAPIVALLFDRAYLSETWATVWKERRWVHAGMFAMSLWLVAATFVLPKLQRLAAQQPSVTAETNSEQQVPTSNQISPSRNSTAVANGAQFELKVTDLYPDRWSYLRSQPRVILHYLQLVFLPVNQCLDYLWPVTTEPAMVIASSLAVIGLIGLSIWGWRRSPRIGFLGLAFFLILSPTSSVIPLNLAFEHRMYLPLACVIAATTLGIGYLLRRQLKGDSPSIVVLGLLPFAIALGGLTVARNQLYHNELAMWQDVIDKAPHNPRAYNEYAWGLMKEGAWKEAREPLIKAIELMPHFWNAQANLAAVEEKLGNTQAMLVHARIAWRLQPNQAAHRALLVRALVAVGHGEEAERLALKFLDQSPQHPQVRFELANLWLQSGKLQQANEQFEMLAEQLPRSSEIAYSLGVIQHAMNQTERARDYYERALKLAEDNALAHNNLGCLLRDQGQIQAAFIHFDRAIEADPQLAQPHLNAGRLHLSVGERERGIRHLQRAAKLAPHDHQILSELEQVMRSRVMSDSR